MTFKHKLSARLARLWWRLPLFALLLTISCDIRARSAVDPTQMLQLVELWPAAVTLGPDATTDFVAVGFTAGGDTVATAVNWNVTGGQLIQETNSGGRHVGRYKAGRQPGNYRVIVSAESQQGGLASDTANVLVSTIPVATVVVSPATVALDVGQTAQLTATPQDSNGAALSGRTITWSSGNTAVATVNSSGLVTARAAGSTTVTATSEGKSGVATATVTQVPVALVEVTPVASNLSVGGTLQLTVVAKDSTGRILSGRPMSWISSNAQIATVAAGLVTGVAVGTALIVASTEGKSDTATITVMVTPVASVTVSPSSTNVVVGATVQLTATTKDSNGYTLTGRPVSWTSGDVAVATVSGTGLVTGVAAGSANVSATSEGISGSSAVTVTVAPPPPPPPPPPAPVASVTVSPDAASVFVDGNLQFSAILKDGAGNLLTGRTVTWSSGNPAVASVSASGMARGVATGTAAITALSEGITGSASLTVITAPPVGQCGAWPAGITAWIQPLAPSTGQAFYASPTGSDANPGTLAAPWRSLSKANSLQPGQTLYLRAGTYGARGTRFDFNRSGTLTAPITVSGYPGDGRPILHGQIYVNGSYVRLTNVVIDGPTGNVGGPGPNGEGNMIILWGSHLELSNSEVRFGQWHAGVGVDGGFHYRIFNNYIHDNGGYLGNFSKSDPSWNNDHGVYASPSSYGLIANNVIEHNSAKGLMGRHDANHIMVVNNTVVGNGRFGIDINESTHDWTMANNILLNNGTIKGGGGIGTPGSGGTSYIEINNLFWNNGTSGTTTWDNNATVINNVVANPLLVNPAVATDQQNPNPNTDNRLQAGSPAIGFADPNFILPFDITGKCRGASPDAGAYER